MDDIKALADRLREHRTDFDDDLRAAAILDHLAAADPALAERLLVWADDIDGTRFGALDDAADLRAVARIIGGES